MMRTSCLPCIYLLAIATAIGGAPSAVGQVYQPLESLRGASDASGRSIASIAFEFRDAQRNRELPLRAYLPADEAPQPVVLFSHGLGGSRDNNQYLGKHLATRGYVAIFLQHPGSDEAVWKGKRVGKIMAAMRQAANGQNLKLRCEDVAVVVSQLKHWNADGEHALHGRMQPDRVGVSGHSFGAHTVQAVLGQAFPLVGTPFKTTGLRAGIAYSPSAPARGDPGRAFRKIDKPLMLMTGTKDDSPIGSQTPDSRLKVFPALPKSIARYELVLDGAQHLAFSDRKTNRLLSSRRNPNHHRVILALSTAFWDAHLRDDAEARAWLHGSGPRELMESGDRWRLAAENEETEPAEQTAP